jgi:ComF family protein
MVVKLWHKLFDILFLRRCIFCRFPAYLGQDLCYECAEDIQKLSFNNEVKHFIQDENCGFFIAKFVYEPPISNLILALKFCRKLEYARVLGGIFAKYLANYYKTKVKPEVIIPVPLHYKRLKQRGFNQVVEIAKPIAQLMQIPLDLHCCIRQKNTVAQATLSASEREHNVKNAFKCRIADLNYKYVAVIDDVITTGNTVFALCNELRNAQVQCIDIWSLAKTKDVQL